MNQTKFMKKTIEYVIVLGIIFTCLIMQHTVTLHAATKKLKVSAPKTVAINRTITIKTNVKAKFKSSNKKIATVTSKGVVKGKKPGKVKITVTSKKNKKQKKSLWQKKHLR